MTRSLVGGREQILKIGENNLGCHNHLLLLHLEVCLGFHLDIRHALGNLDRSHRFIVGLLGSFDPPLHILGLLDLE